MADNYDVKNATGGTETLRATDSGGVKTPHHHVASLPTDPFGANADAAVVTDTTGTISGKLRGIVKMIAERWPASLGKKAASASLPVTLSSDDPLPTKVSTVNSTATPLGAGSTFTGTSEDVSKFRSIVVSVKASHASATDGLKIQFSSDGTNWDIEKTFTLSAADGEHYITPVLAQYFRIVYVNGGTLQTYFRLQSIIHPTLAGLPTVVADGQQSLPVSGAVSLATSTTGGLTPYTSLSVVATGVNVKASAGQLYGWYFRNLSSEWRYLKFYNKASAPTVGSDTPHFVFMLPPSQAGNCPMPQGVAFSLGLGIAATTGHANADTGAPSANEVMLTMFYA